MGFYGKRVAGGGGPSEPLGRGIEFRMCVLVRSGVSMFLTSLESNKAAKEATGGGEGSEVGREEASGYQTTAVS